MAKDFYGILGVPKTASADELKQAYRKLSKELHPDKHKGDKAAEQRFKDVNEAYETLSDSDKRKRYDQFGSAGTNGNGGFGGGNGFGGFDFSNFSQGDASGFGDIFESFFGGRASPGARDKGNDHEVQVYLTLKDVLQGKQFPLTFERFVFCKTCEGDGAEPGTKIVTCKQCGGTGQVMRVTNSLFGQIQQRSVCPTCKGSGTVPEKPCRTCSGEGRVRERSTITVDIPAGIEDGQTLRVRGQGDAGRKKSVSGDLFVQIHVQQDKSFARNGSDIHSTLKIDLLTALLGGEVDVATLHGNVKLAIAEGTQPGGVLRIKGKGLPEVGRSRHGDQYVTVSVEVPRKLSRAERKLVEEWRGMRGS